MLSPLQLWYVFSHSAYMMIHDIYARLIEVWSGKLAILYFLSEHTFKVYSLPETDEIFCPLIIITSTSETDHHIVNKNVILSHHPLYTLSPFTSKLWLTTQPQTDEKISRYKFIPKILKFENFMRQLFEIFIKKNQKNYL